MPHLLLIRVCISPNVPAVTDVFLRQIRKNAQRFYGRKKMWRSKTYKGRKPDWVLRSLAALAAYTYRPVEIAEKVLSAKNTIDFTRKSLKNALNDLVFISFFMQIYFFCNFVMCSWFCFNIISILN